MAISILNHFKIVKMMKYERTTFEDGDTDPGDAGSMGSLEQANVVSQQTQPPDVTFRASSNQTSSCVSMWKNLSNLERLLFIFCAILLVTVLVLVLVVAKRKPTDYCLSPACVTVASSLLNSMDTSIDPCDDFYQYACGGWIKSHPIPDGNSRWSTFGVLWQENQLVMKNALEKPLNESLNEAEIKAKVYYQSCMDKKKFVEKLKAKPLLEAIKLVGGWSVTGKWNESQYDFDMTLTKLQSEFDVQPFYGLWVGTDDKQSSKNIIQIDQSGLGLPNRDYYLNKNDSDPILTAYLEYMTTLTVLLGAEENETRSLMVEVLEFEKDLANITVPSDQRRDEETLYHRIKLKDLFKKAPAFKWLKNIKSLFEKADVTDITEDEDIILYCPDYIEQVSDLILKTPKIVINNYMLWKLVTRLSPFLNQDFRDAAAALAEVLYGASSKTDLWRFCVTDTDGSVGMALGEMFVREAFDGNSKETAKEMINEIREAFKRNFPNLDWMDDETRKAAREKADAVVDMIGFPNYILDSSKLNERYKGLEFNADEYFANNLRLVKFDLKRSHEKLRKPVNRTRWEMTPPTVNAYYTPTKNEIVFPAGILQTPFYDKEYPRSLNFGGIGVVVGHELTHGFDDQGREYDKNGNMLPWWNNATIKKFKERTECMVDKYSEYKVSKDNVNGKQTLGENIADNGGLKAAYYAYEGWIRDHGGEQLLPALNLTHRQLFFLGFAQVWCSSSTPESSHLQILDDPHSPAKYRVIGTLSNSYEFAQQYNCPTGSLMNPQKKCEVW